MIPHSNKYFGSANDFESVISQFTPFDGTAAPDVTEDEIIFAWISEADYSMSAFILFTPDELYEVDGSHCSCYGFEDQWVPDEVTWEQLAMRPIHTWVMDRDTEAQAALTALIRQHVPEA